MTIDLETAILCAGYGQLSVLVASALVPVRLDWRHRLAELPPLVRQLFWVYGGYVVLSIISLGLICIFKAKELAHGTGLARAVCTYAATFWGIRLALQAVLSAKPFLTTWWLKAGYGLLTILFTLFTVVFCWGAFATVERAVPASIIG